MRSRAAATRGGKNSHPQITQTKNTPATNIQRRSVAPTIVSENIPNPQNSQYKKYNHAPYHKWFIDSFLNIKQIWQHWPC
jgi:hypothetical protein